MRLEPISPAALRGLALCALLQLLPRTGAAQVVPLAELERVALKQRPELAIPAAGTRAAAAEVDKAKSAYMPRLALEAQAGLAPGGQLVRVLGEPAADGGANPIYVVPGAPDLKQDPARALAPQLRGQLGVELKGNLYDFGRTRAAVAAGRAKQDAAGAQLESTRGQIVRAVRAAYVGWLGASELAGIAAQAAADAKQRRERAQGLIDEGARPKSDLSAASAEELLAQLELDRTQGQLVQARLAVAQAAGAPLAEGATPDRALLAQPSPAPDAPDAALHGLQLEERAAHAQAHALSRSDAPQLAGNAVAGVRSQAAHVYPAYALGVSFSLPLWDGGSTQATAAAARARAEEIAARIALHREDRRAEVARASAAAASAETRLATAERLRSVAEQRVADTEASRSLGAGNPEQQAQARSLLQRAKTEILLAQLARLEASLLSRSQP